MSLDLKLGSLFDGSGTAPLAASMCGIDPIWASEIEPYPIAVTKARFPQMQHLGSILDVDGSKVVPVDIICGGSPCQDLSVAGKQAGIHNGERSHLFFEMTRIIKEMRGATNGKYPRYIVWENVPGAFSSNKGRDFLAVLQSFAEIADPDVHVPEPESKSGRLAWKYAGEIVGDGWPIAWRTVDAQYWGVPQCRRRIYLVADLGSERAGEILFEREGVSGDSESGGTARKGTAADVESCSLRSGGVRCLNPWDSQSIRQYSIDGCYPALSANSGGGQMRNGVVYPVIARTLTAEHDASPCVDRGQNVIVRATSFKAGNGSNAHGIGYDDEITPTLTAAPSGTNQVPSVCIEKAVFEPCSMRDENWAESEAKNALRAGASKSSHAVVEQYLFENHSQDTRYKGPLDISPMLPAQLGTGGNNTPFVVEGEPVYCLQGNGIDRADTAGCNGKGWKEDTSYTLNTIDRPAVTHLASRKETVGTLMANAGTKLWLGNQEAFSGDYHIIEEQAARHVVRRLTPTECARLQGFADRWGEIDEKDNLTDEEFFFWRDVRNTHALINGRDEKGYSKTQMLNWYNKLHTDSAEYKMWGNGMALPNMLFVMKRITAMQ